LHNEVLPQVQPNLAIFQEYATKKQENEEFEEY